MKPELQHLLQRRDIWQGRHPPPGAAQEHSIATGYPELDQQLYGGGWPAGAAVELLSETAGIGELALLMPALENCARQKQRLWWIDPPYLPYAPALSARGLRLDTLLLVHTRHWRQQLWALEQVLRSQAAAVLCWLAPQIHRYAQLRKLQVAADDGNTLGFFFRRQSARQQASPAALRLLLRAAADPAIPPRPGPAELAITICKQRGGTAGATVYLPRELARPQPAFSTLAVHPSLAQPDKSQAATGRPTTRKMTAPATLATVADNAGTEVVLP